MMTKKLTLKDLAVKHDYYCSDSNYSNEESLTYDTFEKFFNVFKNTNVDLNLVFRWDLKLCEDKDADYCEIGEYYLEIFQIKQRKGMFTPILIKSFKESDIPLFLEYLKPHIEKLKNIWKPFEF